MNRLNVAYTESLLKANYIECFVIREWKYSFGISGEFGEHRAYSERTELHWVNAFVQAAECLPWQSRDYNNINSFSLKRTFNINFSLFILSLRDGTSFDIKLHFNHWRSEIAWIQIMASMVRPWNILQFIRVKFVMW